MRIVCFGGTFDPPHKGHELLIREVLTSGHGDLAVVVPVHIPAHKEIETPVDPADRLEMARLAFGGIEGCVVDGSEIERGGVSYTYDTVGVLEEHYRPREKISIVVGYDLVPGLSSWKEWDKLKNRVRFIIARRNGEDVDTSSLDGCDWVFLDNPRIDVSSRMIRERCGRGEDVHEYICPRVAQYIMQRGLYGAQKSCNP